MSLRRLSAALPILMISAAYGGTAHAQSAPASSPPLTTGGFSWAQLARQDSLLGQMGGLRTAMANAGLSFTLTETSEVLGNVTGGVRKGFEYDGLTTGTVQLDTEKAFDWKGGTFNVSMLNIHGRNLSADNLLTLQTASGIESPDATRLWEAWFQQGVGDDGDPGSFSVKIGQQSIDSEFITSPNTSLFVNTMMGWPAVPSYDLPSGGPAYPNSALGVRFKTQPTGNTTLLAGLYNGDPYGEGRANNNHGTAFRLQDGVLAITELQYAVNQPTNGQVVHPEDPEAGLPGTYKIGAWYDSEPIPDLSIDNTGASLALTGGTPKTHAGTYAFYGVIDQAIWRPDPDSTRSLNVFLRVMGGPGDRGPGTPLALSYSANGGITLKGPFEDREEDSVGLGFGYVKVAPGTTANDRDNVIYTGAPPIVRKDETFVELTYQYQATGWWQIQPDVQYVFNPGGGIPNPNSPTNQRLADELVLGVRTNINF